MMNICCKKRKFLRTGLNNSILSMTKGLELHRNVQYGSYNVSVGSKTLHLKRLVCWNVELTTGLNCTSLLQPWKES